MRMRKKGFSLVEILAAMGVLGIITLASLRMFGFNQKNLHSTMLTSDARIMASQILYNINCEETLGDQPSIDCSPDKYVDLKAETGSLFLNSGSSNGARFGDWDFRARCSNSQKRLVVESRLTDKNGNLKRDPISKKFHDWAPLYPELRLCSYLFDTTTPSVEDYECHVGSYIGKTDTLENPTYVSGWVDEDDCAPNCPSFYAGCKSPYTRVSCGISVNSSMPDLDLKYSPNSCKSDDEEFNAEGKLTILCCRRRE